MTSSFDNEYASIYEALYADKNYKLEADYILSLLDQWHLRGDSDILEIGTGTGSHAAIIQANPKNYRVWGLEPSSSMAQQALGKGLNVEINSAQNLAQSYQGKIFDACLALFHVFSYLTDDRDIQSFINGLAEKIRAGGIVVFDVWHEEAVLGQGMEVRVKRVPVGGQGELVRVAEPFLNPAEKLAHVNYELFLREGESALYKRFAETHKLRFFSEQDIRDLWVPLGFDFLDSHEFLTKNIPSAQTWGVTYIFGRRAQS